MSIVERGLLLIALLSSPALSPEAQARQDFTTDRPVLRAVRVTQAPVLDGRVEGDLAWAAVPFADLLVQTQPDAGSPASEKTEIRVAYSGDTLYVAAILFDRDPGRIIASDSRRDAPLDETDSFSFIIDTYRDGQNGFVFGTNPAGIEYDAQVSEEGQGGFGLGRQMGGAGAGFNINWDGAWLVRAHVGEFGWSAEFAIPFRTLRFSTDPVQSWGINFQRNIRRRNERSFWASLPRHFNLYRVSLAGSLENVAVPALRNLTIVPYALTQARRSWETGSGVSDQSVDVGIDVKYGLTPSLTLDATVNTDFAQVEVDDQQVNLDRFNLFFPEKRPFFLENAGLFTIGESGEVELFFSRRIGLYEGQTVPILGGLRLSGQAGDTRVGLLSMQTRGVDDLVAGANVAVARVQRELPNRSAVGVLVTNRERTGDPVAGASGSYNRLVALDGRLGIGQYTLLSAFISRTASPDGLASPYAVNVDARLDSEEWIVSGSYTQVGAGFNPELGFLRRSGYRKAAASVFRRIRPDSFLGLYEIRPHTNYRAYWGFDGLHETGYWHLDSHWEWPGGWQVHTGTNFTREGVRESFDISDGVAVPADTYDHHEVQLVAITDQSRWISFETRVVVGGFFGGDRISTSPSLRIRRGDALTGEVRWSRNEITLPGGSFTADLVAARVSYAFSPRVYLQALVQYNDQADLWSANLRFGWLQDANSGLFVVFNQTSELDGFLDHTLARGVTLKYSRRIDA